MKKILSTALCLFAAVAIADDDLQKEAPALNWDAAPVDIVLQTYSEQTDKTILKDPEAPSPTITLKTREGQKLTREEYLHAIEVVLEMNGIHLEPYGEKFIRALPRKDLRKKGIPLIMDSETKLGDTEKVVSVWITFKNIATDEAQKALEGFKSNSGLLLVFERTNSILVTDTEQNINRMLEIARAIDVASPVMENVFVEQIKNANATDIKTALEAIVQESQKEQEKNGKGLNNATAQQNASTMAAKPFANKLAQAKAQQPAQPENNASLVTNVSDADRGMIRGKVLILADERSNKLIIVTQEANMEFFRKVIAQLDVETTPDTVVKVYRLKYAEAEEVSDMINDLIGNAAGSKSNAKQNQNANAKAGSGTNLTKGSGTSSTAQKTSANQRSGEAKAGELTKDNTTVLADKRVNGLVVMTNKELVPVIEQIIEAMDVKLSQVLIETCIIEVTLGDDLQTGIDWVNNRWMRSNPSNSRGLIGGGGGGSGANMLTQMNENNKSYADWVKEARSAYGIPTGTAISDTQVQAYKAASIATSSSGVQPIGAGVNYLLKSNKLNISAVIQASKSDSRSNYLASPVVMTVDNKEAIIEATESRKFYSGSTSSSGAYNSNASYNYSDKDLGIKIKVTPKINPNGTVMLQVEEEYSQLGAGQSVLVTTNNGSPSKENIDTALSRKMSADVILEDRQTVVLGGLTEKLLTEKETGIPLLKDIPWIGKWLFGSVEQSETRKELLVFMTPYVFNDAAEAESKASQLKNAMSDDRPWESNGWSDSKLADPVSQKEHLRRLKNEWKNQDEERKTKLAIEAAKAERVKELEKMSEEERKLWFKEHDVDIDVEFEQDAVEPSDSVVTIEEDSE
jgi:type II secretion system protein D